jgi:hypothetical protein
MGAYDPYAADGMAASAMRTTARKSIGSFGASARALDWGKQLPKQTDALGPTSDETASVKSTFGPQNSARHKGPSAAMGGGSRFAPAKQASGGENYVPPALGASKASNSNRRASLLGTMGSSKRFNEVKVCAPGDYSDAKPGAFSSSSKKKGPGANTGFGGTSSRVTAFDAAAKRAEENAASHLAYDGAYASTGAFAKASEATNKPSAAFSSKSSQRMAVQVQDGPGAQSYSTASIGSISSTANKSFNKSLQNGTGGFGTSAKRASMQLSARGADVPGPG